MHPVLVRAAKVVGLPIAAVAVVLFAEFLFSIGMVRPADLPWNELVSDDLGTIAAPVEDPAVRAMWPVERDGLATAVVAVASAPGYRSRIEVAVTVAADGTVLAERVVAHAESAYVRRILDADAMSGATLTFEGIQAAMETAVTAGRAYIEEQR